MPVDFPTLSRAPSMDAELSIEDDTLRDNMELGYVATRPRFSRARRTWQINIRNLVQADVDALSTFVLTTVARGAISFYFPVTGGLVGNVGNVLVRFSDLPKFSDLGIGGGVKRYGTTFKVTEV